MAELRGSGVKMGKALREAFSAWVYLPGLALSISVSLLIDSNRNLLRQLEPQRVAIYWEEIGLSLGTCISCLLLCNRPFLDTMALSDCYLFCSWLSGEVFWAGPQAGHRHGLALSWVWDTLVRWLLARWGSMATLRRLAVGAGCQLVCFGFSPRGRSSCSRLACVWISW